MNLRLYLLFIYLFITLLANAQKEAAIWYFGENAGVDFNSGNPVALTDGQVNTTEGCATISDFGGNLLFYTDGTNVWNRNHLVIPNGSGLWGEISSTQSAIIVPAPETPNIFYVFTVYFAGQSPGLNYSVVDMTLDGGMGDIGSQKNIQLESRVSEKLTAVQHANGRDIWVISHAWQSDEFLAYLVTPGGVNPAAVKTAIGVQHYDLDYSGYLKASPDGSKLASCIYDGGIIELFDFNASSGIVSNVLILDSDIQKDYYGIEFSPSGRFLYVVENTFKFPRSSKLIQYDLQTPDIISSAILVHDDMGQYNTQLNALQLGIDGKIYSVNTSRPYLSSIENPEELGIACNFIPRAVDLNGRTGLSGLPQFIQSFFLVSLNVSNLCYGDSTEFEVNSTEPIVSINWDFGDGNTSVLENPNHIYAAAGNYTVSVNVQTATETKTSTKEITISPSPIAFNPGNLVECTTNGSYELDLQSLNASVIGTQSLADFTIDYFLTQQNADDNTNPLEPMYSFAYGITPVFVRVSAKGNVKCYDTTQFEIVVSEVPIVSAVSDWTICDDNTDGFYEFNFTDKHSEILNGQDSAVFIISFYTNQTDADQGLNTIGPLYTNTNTNETIFYRIENSTYRQCFRTGSFIIEVSSGVVANTPSNLQICDDDNDGFSIFNLADNEMQIIGTQNASSLSISYHATMTDAESNLNPLLISYTNSVFDNQTIYVRVANASDISCYATTSFELFVYDTPQLQLFSDWVVCDNDDDGVFNFDLTEKNNEILGGQNPANVSIHYYESLSDANLAQNEITGTYQNRTNPQTLFYRLDNSLHTTCFVISSFDLEVFETPFALAPTFIIGCDINETGSQTIDLTQKNSEILDNQDPSQFTVAYYASQSDAENRINELSANSYINTQSKETLYARVERIGLESCYALANFEIIINPLPQAVLEERYVICPDSPALVIDGGDFETWFWQDANGTEISTTRIFDVTDLGEYQLTVSQTTNGVSCEISVSFEVLSSGSPESIVVETNGFSDQIDVTVTATGTGPFEYSVDGENYQVSNAFTVFPGKYTLYVRDLEECRILSEEIIAIGYQRFFTPNGDGSNEYWNIIGSELYPDSQLFIYDRYGKFLKQLSADSKGWDGKSNGISLPESDYWFKYNYANNQVMTGHFTLKR